MLGILLYGVITSLWLQVYVSSRRDNKWVGLIIPIQSLVVSIFHVYTLLQTPPGANNASAVPVLVMSAFQLAITFGIYFFCRTRVRRRMELERMEMQDMD